MVQHRQGCSGEARKSRGTLCHCLSPSSSMEFPPPCLTRAFFHPTTLSRLQLQPPRARSGFLLLSEGLTVRIWFLQPWGRCPGPCSAGTFSLSTLNQRGKGEAGSPSSFQPCPLQQGVHKQHKQNTDCGGNWFCLGLSQLGLRLHRWIRGENAAVRSLLSFQTRRCSSVLSDKWIFLYPFRQVDISLSIYTSRYLSVSLLCICL